MLNELKKIFNIKIIFLYTGIFALFTVIFWFSLRGVQNGDNTAVREELYDEFGGRITQEKFEALSRYRLYVNEIISMERQMEDGYDAGDISSDEYMEYRSEYHRCNIIHSVVNGLWDRCINEQSASGYLVFDDYYNRIFAGTSVYVCFGITAALTGVLLVVCEPRELYNVIRTTKNGRFLLLRNKHCILSLMITVYTLTYMTVRYIIAGNFYRFKQLGAPACGVACLADLPSWISIGMYMAADIIIKPFLAVVFGNIILSVGMHFKK